MVTFFLICFSLLGYSQFTERPIVTVECVSTTGFDFSVTAQNNIIYLTWMNVDTVKSTYYVFKIEGGDKKLVTFQDTYGTNNMCKFMYCCSDEVDYDLSNGYYAMQYQLIQVAENGKELLNVYKRILLTNKF